MPNPFDIAEGKVNPFDVAEGKINPFDVAESQSVMPSQAVVDAQKLTGTPVAPGMPTSVEQLPDVTKGINDVRIGIAEAPVKLASDLGQFALEASTPFKYLENMLFGDTSGEAFKNAQEHTRGQQELINYQPVSKMGAQLPQIPFLPVTAAMAGIDKVLDFAGGEGTPDASGSVPLRKQAAEGVKQGLLSSLAMLGIKKAMDVAPVGIAEKPKVEPIKPVENIKEVTKTNPFDVAEKLPQSEVQAGGIPFGAELPKYAGNINLNRVNNTYEAKRLILETADTYKGKIDSARRGKITHEATKELADNLGMTAEKLTKRKQGKAFNAEEALAARDILNASSESLANKHKAIAESGGSEQSLVDFKLAMEQHALLQAQVSGVAAEAGRALSIHKFASDPASVKSRNYKEMLDALGGREMTEELASRLAKIDPADRYAVNKFVREVTKVKTADQVYWVWLNSILSSPLSHAANIVSNTLTGMTRPFEKGTAASIDVLRSLVTGKERERFFGEVHKDVFGAIQGMKEGTKAAMKAWLDDMPQMEMTKFEVKPAPIKGKVGRFLGGPTRALMAADEFFKSIIYRSEINSLAYRQASTEGLKGKAKASRIAELADTPLDWMHKRAVEEAKYRTFQKELGKVGTKAMNLRNESMATKVLFPFIKTPTNIVKFGLERTPLEFMDIGLRMAKGELKGGAISEQMAKPILGTIISGAFLSAIQDGNVSGAGPVNKNERDAKYRTGWQPYSIKVGDKWYSYKRLEPIGMIVGLTADASEIWNYANAEEKTSLAAAVSTAIGQNILNKTWMQGASNALNAITDPTRYGESWVQSLVGSTVPGIVATTARATDPHMRQAQDIIDGIKTRIPVLSQQVLPKLNLWGEPIKKSEGVAEQTVGKIPSRMLSPVQVSPESNSKIDKEIVRLIGTGYMQAPGAPSKQVGGIDLTPKQHQEMQARGGGLAKKALEKIVEGEAYKKAPDMAKTKIIESVINSYRTMASAEMLGKLKAEQGSDVVAQGAARTSGIIPKNTKPSPEKKLSEMLKGIRGNQ